MPRIGARPKFERIKRCVADERANVAKRGDASRERRVSRTEVTVVLRRGFYLVDITISYVQLI